MKMSFQALCPFSSGKSFVTLTLEHCPCCISLSTPEDGSRLTEGAEQGFQRAQQMLLRIFQSIGQLCFSTHCLSPLCLFFLLDLCEYSRLIILSFSFAFTWLLAITPTTQHLHITWNVFQKWAIKPAVTMTLLFSLYFHLLFACRLGGAVQTYRGRCRVWVAKCTNMKILFLHLVLLDVDSVCVCVCVSCECTQLFTPEWATCADILLTNHWMKDGAMTLSCLLQSDTRSYVTSFMNISS